MTIVEIMVMAAISHTVKHRADTIIGVIWALGMAIGIILIDLTPGYYVDLMSYLFGSILTVPRSDLFAMAVVGLILTILVIYYYRDLLAVSYDEEFARIRGVPVKKLCFGQWNSYRYNLTAGASIILVSGIVFLISLVVDKARIAVRK